jgi:hypothetical protein
VNEAVLLLKEVPIKAIPFAVFLASTAVFGEILIRMPNNSLIQQSVSFIFGFFTIISALMFFSKVLFNFPPMRGLELD